MKLTNKLNLPEVIVRAVQNDSYSRGDSDYTVTELLGPPRQRALQKKHREEIVEDVSDRLYSLYGQIGHGILERAGAKDELTEKRFYADYGGSRVSAQIDSLTLIDGTLTDWKFTSSYKFLANKPKPFEYIWQLNMQKDILEKNGIRVKSLQICGLLRDWQKSKAKFDKQYPQTSICLMPIDLYTSSMIEDFILTRINLFKEADVLLPECTREDTWNNRRCADYCNINGWCTQYQISKGVSV